MRADQPPPGSRTAGTVIAPPLEALPPRTMSSLAGAAVTVPLSTSPVSMSKRAQRSTTSISPSDSVTLPRLPLGAGATWSSPR